MQSIADAVYVVSGVLGGIVLFHAFVVSMMILAIIVEPQSIQHTQYWDSILRIIFNVH